jgi:hypothetical protein
MSPEERAARDARRAEVDRLLEQRIAHHRRKLDEERTARERPARRRLFRRG